jgi:hypothetical protein
MLFDPERHAAHLLQIQGLCGFETPGRTMRRSLYSFAACTHAAHLHGHLVSQRPLLMLCTLVLLLQ